MPKIEPEEAIEIILDLRPGHSFASKMEAIIEEGGRLTDSQHGALIGILEDFSDRELEEAGYDPWI